MTNNAKNVIVAKPKVTGGILVAPVGTALPVDETTALDPLFKAVGYSADSGVTRTEKHNTNIILAWGGDVIAVAQKSYEATAKLVLEEYLNPVTQALLYGATNVISTPATASTGNKLAIKVTADLSPHNTIVIEMRSGLAAIRIVFPDAQITEAGDVIYNDGVTASRPITLMLFPDSSGVYFHEYTNDGVFAGA